MSDPSEPLSDPHCALLRHLSASSVGLDPPHVFEVLSEWLGYLPYGAYIWVTDMPDSAFPGSWDSGDMTHLSNTGYLDLLTREVFDEDGFDTRTVYRLTAKALALSE